MIRAKSLTVHPHPSSNGPLPRAGAVALHQLVLALAACGSSGSIANITVQVTRRSLSYGVHLQLAQEGSSWKITGFDIL